MKIIEEGIVFSDDIGLILKGRNALDFKYERAGMILPDENFYKYLRESFFKETKEIFNGKVTVLKENEMIEGMEKATQDVIGRFPHCFIR